ncbi:MAG: hypothetical protein NZ932_04720 [Candidatus Bathyarchaeota archaeon]|nr:hypothetical protein [Candidatus Bathyarchaeota archaeon]MCX8177413.1 hypothetical protein [Candidatus Bathyarchaeota archaeon]
MKSIKIEDDVYIELLKLKASLTAKNGKARTFSQVVKELLESYKKK